MPWCQLVKVNQSGSVDSYQYCKVLGEVNSASTLASYSNFLSVRRLLPREPVLMTDTGTSGARVAHELDALVRVYGKPACVVSDNVLCAELLADLASLLYRDASTRSEDASVQLFGQRQSLL